MLKKETARERHYRYSRWKLQCLRWKSHLDGFNSTWGNAEEKIKELEDTAIETFQKETLVEKIKPLKKKEREREMH